GVAADQHDVSRYETIDVFQQIVREGLSLPEGNLPFGGDVVGIEPLGPVVGELHEVRSSPQRGVLERVEVELADDALRLFAQPAPPRSAGSFERIRQKVDADLRNLRLPVGTIDIVGVVVELEATLAAQIGIAPLVAQYAVLLAPLVVRLVEGQLLLDLGAHRASEGLDHALLLLTAPAVQAQIPRRSWRHDLALELQAGPGGLEHRGNRQAAVLEIGHHVVTSDVHQL